MKTINNIAKHFNLKVESFTHGNNKKGYILYSKTNSKASEELVYINGKQYPEVYTFYPTAKENVFDIYDYVSGVVHYDSAPRFFNRILGITPPNKLNIKSLIRSKFKLFKDNICVSALDSSVIVHVYTPELTLNELKEKLIYYDVSLYNTYPNVTHYKISTKIY